VFYLKYDMYRQNFPLLALATYLNYRNGLGTRTGFYRCEGGQAASLTRPAGR